MFFFQILWGAQWGHSIWLKESYIGDHFWSSLWFSNKQHYLSLWQLSHDTSCNYHELNELSYHELNELSISFPINNIISLAFDLWPTLAKILISPICVFQEPVCLKNIGLKSPLYVCKRSPLHLCKRVRLTSTKKPVYFKICGPLGHVTKEPCICMPRISCTPDE